MARDVAARTAVVINDTRIDRHHGCSAVMARIELGLAQAGLQVAASSPAHADWESDEGFLRALEGAALVLVNGEGTIHHDRPAGRRLLRAGAVARRAGVQSALVNCGWQANGPELAALAAEFSLVSARDSRSAAELRAAGVDCRVVPDLSLATPWPPVATTRHGTGVTDSVDRDETLRLERLRRTLGGVPVAVQFPRSDRRMDRLRFVREGLARADLASPALAVRRAAARRTQLAASRHALDDFLARLAGLELVVSGRFHVCTLAMVVGTPFLAAATNSHKIQALVEDAGLDPARLAAPDDPAGIARAARVGWSDAESAALAAYLARARSEADALFSDIGRLACG